MTPLSHSAAWKVPAASFRATRPLAFMVAVFAFALALPASASGLFDGGKPKAGDWDKAREGQRVLIEGTLRLVGNEPFTETVITDSEGRDWFLDAEGELLLARKEHRTVRVTGTVALKPMTLANGKKLPDRRTLVELELSE